MLIRKLFNVLIKSCMVGYLCKVIAAQAKCRLNRGVSYLSITRLGGYFGAFGAVGYIGEQRVVLSLTPKSGSLIPSL